MLRRLGTTLPVLNVRDRTMAGLLLSIGVILFLTMPRWLYPGDPISMQVSSINLITQARLDVTPSQAAEFGERGQYFHQHPGNGHWHSKYGLFNMLYFTPPLWLEYTITGELKPVSELDQGALQLRTLILNLWNIAISLIFVFYLYYSATLCGAEPASASKMVLLVIFGSFVWYYLRAQTVELLQMTLFSIAVYHLLAFSLLGPLQQRNGPGTVHALAAMTALGSLALAKLIYIVLLPLGLVFFAAYLFRRSLAGSTPLACRGKTVLPLADPKYQPHEQENSIASRWSGWKTLTVAAVCVILSGSLILLSNWWRFGSPWSTGYTQFARESMLFRFRWEGWWGYLLDGRKSLFLYCPVLLFGLLGLFWLPRAIRPVFCWAWIAFGILYGLNASFVNWRGDWCYGPRYLIVALPTLSLPLAVLLSRTARYRPLQTWGMVVVAACSLLSINSLTAIHGVSFFAAFEAEQAFELENLHNASISDYFRQPHWRINSDQLAYRLGRKPFPPFEAIPESKTPEQRERVISRLKNIPLQNYFWIDILLSPPPATPTENATPNRKAVGLPVLTTPRSDAT
jgi:hypothetical protein